MAAKGKEDIILVGHLLRRAGFGATREELEAYAATGYEGAVEVLLHPEGQPALEEDLLLRLNMGWQNCQAHYLALTYWLYRMINTKRPLEEKIALFWHGILCTGYAKLDQSPQMTATVDTYRRLGLGSFRDLLLATAKDPGMIYYLDNCMSHKGAINENWGRELLELFSMGVGNYTEDDVMEASRAFSGWTNAPTFPEVPWGRSVTWDFFYDPTDHENEEKAFLGQRGRFNGEDIVDIICRQPATARFLARQLYNFFVADEPPVPQWGNTPPLDPLAIDFLVEAYFDSHYDVRSTLRALFSSDFFKKASFQKVKSPTEIVVGTARLAKDLSFPEPRLYDLVKQTMYMGQELHNPPSVEGWHSGQEWIDSGSLVERVNYLSGQLGDGNKPGVREITGRLVAGGKALMPEDLVDGCLEQLGGLSLGDETRRNLIGFASKGGPVDSASGELARRTAGMLGMIVATKEYQLN